MFHSRQSTQSKWTHVPISLSIAPWCTPNWDLLDIEWLSSEISIRLTYIPGEHKKPPCRDCLFATRSKPLHFRIFVASFALWKLRLLHVCSSLEHGVAWRQSIVLILRELHLNSCWSEYLFRLCLLVLELLESPSCEYLDLEYTTIFYSHTIKLTILRWRREESSSNSTNWAPRRLREDLRFDHLQSHAIRFCLTLTLWVTSTGSL